MSHTVGSHEVQLSLAVGAYHTVCVAGDGRVFAWGRGSEGQGDTKNVLHPVEVPGMPPIRSVSCGVNFTMCVGRDFVVPNFPQILLGVELAGTQSRYKSLFHHLEGNFPLL